MSLLNLLKFLSASVRLYVPRIFTSLRQRRTDALKMKVFVLGDSRTGTTSVNEYFVRSGLRSIHYYMDEAGVADPLHVARAANWTKMHHFIEHSGFQAFSDYPTRFFYRELATAYPGAFFILTTRRDVATWRKSMMRLPAVREEDINSLCENYLSYNENIRTTVREFGLRFLEICIEDNSTETSKAISAFLNLPWAGPLLKVNTAAELAAAKALSASHSNFAEICPKVMT